MVNRPFVKSLRPVLLVFFLITALLLVTRWLYEDALVGKRIDALLAGNAVLFLATVLSFYFYSKALNNNNTQFFLRMMYSSLLAKMLICLGAALIYVWIARSGVSKTIILGCFGLYVLYTVVEVKVLMRSSKLQKNA